MKRLRIFWIILKRTHADKILSTFIINLFIVAIFVQLVEPEINTYLDSLWFCFVSFTSIGFGDIVPVTLIGRLLTVYITLHAILVLAIIPGIVTSYYIEIVARKEKESATILLDKLERLPELSKEELTALSEKIKKIK